MVQQILGNSTEEKNDESYPKDPYFLYNKTLRNGTDLRKDRYLWMLRLSNLSPLGNLSHGVFFSVDLFFKRSWKAYEHYGCSCWKP